MFTEEILTGTLFGLGLGTIVLFTLFIALLIMLIVFLYKAFALYTIAKKLNCKYAWIAWIPIAQFFLYPILAEEDWGWGFIALIPIAIPLLFLPFTIVPFINIFLVILIAIGGLIFIIFKTYWLWKIFEKRKYHGALSLLTLIDIVDLVVLGIVAWKDKTGKVKHKAPARKTVVKKKVVAKKAPTKTKKKVSKTKRKIKK